MKEVQNLFRKTFGLPPRVTIRAPAQLELLGHLPDQNHTLALGIALDTDLTLAATPRQDQWGHMVSTQSRDKCEFKLSRLAPGNVPVWAKPIVQVLEQLRRHKLVLRGFNAVLSSDIPPIPVLGESLAIAAAFALAYRELFPYTLTPTGSTTPPRRDDDGHLSPLTKTERLEMARLCQAAQSPPTSSTAAASAPMLALFGKAFHAAEIDAQSGAVELIPWSDKLAVILIDSGATVPGLEEETALQRTLCSCAAQILRVKSLRAAELKSLQASRAQLTPDEFEAARHAIEENRRVLFASRALRDGDVEQFGQYLLQSHSSATQYFPGTCPGAGHLLALARHHPACYGARTLGAATVNLVRDDLAAGFIEALRAHWLGQTGGEIQPRRVRLADAASRV